eukprot:gene1890-4984_t
MPLLSQIIFNAHDKDNSGNIDADELKSVAQALRIIDKDNSGHISYDEFKAWWARKDRFQVLKDEQETQEDAQQWGEWLQATTNHFNFFDKDRNGVISREEFTALYQNLSQHYKLPSLMETLKQLDSDNDGVVTLDEYVKWLRQQAH